MITWTQIVTAALLGVVSYTWVMSWFRKKVKFEGAHILITGGSEGIGFALAKKFVKRNASVTIVARTQSKLDASSTALDKVIKEEGLQARVFTYSADVTSYEEVQGAVQAAEGQFGPIDVVATCAGAAYPGLFIEQDVAQYQHTMNLDFFGTLHVLKSTIPGMVRRGAGRVLLVASPMAITGFIGYSTYSPAKYAVRGLADVLRNELAGSGVTLSIGYPLDTDTPGFANENLTKPPETDTISKIGGAPLYTAEQIAESFVKGLERGSYHIKTPDILVNVLISSMASLSPKPYPLLVEVLIAPFAVLLQAIYMRIIDRIVLKGRRKSQAAAA